MSKLVDADTTVAQKVDRRYKGTEERIIQAAHAEIVRHGIAGARIHRIASEAGTSTERIYSYFGNRSRLIQAVINDRMGRVERAARFDPYDIESYVVWLFDFYTSHPDEVRFSQWVALDRAASEQLDDPRLLSLTKRVEQVREAQTKGAIDRSWDPLILLNLLVGLAMSWATAPYFVQHLSEIGQPEVDVDKRRQAVKEAARRLMTPEPTGKE